MQWDRFYLGSSYYPEQWPQHRWEEDFRKMHELGHNTVRMGEFAWAFFEPEAGTFRFDWMDTAIDMAAHYGIHTLLCTPTASVPPWLRQLHPEVLGGNEKGPFDYGARKGYCTNATAMLEAADRIVTAMANHFGGNKAILGWQLDNEPGYPFTCFDNNCRVGFQHWLQKKYGSLEALNAAWGGAFWSHIYSDWAQIEFPINRPDGDWNPGERLDYRRFFSDSFTRYLQRQITILREHIGDQFIYTNWPNACWSIDVFEMGTRLDITAWDNYCANPGVTDHHEQYVSGMNHDICRCAGPHQRFMLAEQSAQVAAHALSDGVRLQTYIDLAHGAYGTVFFEWRPPVAGAEQGYISVLQMDGSFGPAYEQHKRICVELARIGPILAGATTAADIALVFSYENEWEQGFWNGSNGYDAEAQRYYNGLKALQRNIDCIPISADLSKYRLVCAPGLRVISDEDAKRLRTYVQDGGILLLNIHAGTRDPYNRIREMLPPGVFAEIAGITVPSRSSSAAMAGNLIQGKADQRLNEQLAVVFSGDDEGFLPATTLELIELHGAEVLASFRGGRMTDKPGITINSFGKGFVLYVGTDSYDLKFHERLADLLREQFAISPLFNAPFGVEVTSREKDGVTYYFLLNLTEETKTFEIPDAMMELIGGTKLQGDVPLGPLDVMILTRA